MTSAKRKGRGGRVLRSLQAKVSVAIVVLSTLVFFGFSFYDYSVTRSREFAELEEDADILANRLSRTLLNPVWNVDRVGALEILRTEMADRRVASIVIYEEDGTKVFTGQWRDSDWNRSDTPGPALKADTLVRSRDFFMDGFGIGVVEVQLTTRFIWESLREKVMSLLLRTVLLEITLVLFFFLYIRVTVIHPLKTLVRGLKGVARSQDYSRRLPQGADDELGDLFDSFNEMLAKLESRDQRLKEHSGQLEALVRARTAELEEASEAAERASNAKSQLLANVSHEIRTPMNAIIGMAEIALEGELTPKQREHLRIIRDSSRSLLTLVNDFLDFSKMEADRLVIERISFDLPAIFDEVADLFRDKVSDKGVELVLDVAENVPQYLIGDPLRLKQVLVNLSANALKFTEQGEVCVSAGVHEDRGDRVCVAFCVRDTGIGIPEHVRSRLFEAFTQADGTTTRRFGGTGLGLTISQRLVQYMGGEIEVLSEVGRGSEFCFQLTFEKSADKVRARSLPREIHGKRVLVVEDSESNRRVLTRMLGRMGMETDAASSGEEGLSLLREKPGGYGLILLDWRLPGIDGLEMYSVLKRTAEHVPPVVMMTAFGLEGIVRKAEALGVGGFLMKPIKPARLYEAVLEVFGFSSLSRLESSGGLSDFPRVKAHGLLVEDNDVNQQVAKEILESYGITVDLADNGREALRMLGISESGEDVPGEAAAYDFVLMDMQMPVMDGFEATAKIRADSRYSALPVIAMTAHAMSGDRERCLKAGMDEYVAKPIDRALFIRVLLRCLGHGESEEKNGMGALSKKHTGSGLSAGAGGVAGVSAGTLAAIAGVAASQPQEVAMPDLPGIDTDDGLRRLGGKRELFFRVLGKFHESFSGEGERIREALDSGDRELVRRLVHTLAGSAGNISAHSLRGIAKELERMAHEGDLSAVSRELPRLEKALGEVLGAIASQVGNPEG